MGTFIRISTISCLFLVDIKRLEEHQLVSTLLKISKEATDIFLINITVMDLFSALCAKFFQNGVKFLKYFFFF